MNISHLTHGFEVTGGVKDSGDDCDSDSDYEDMMEGIGDSTREDTGSRLGRESEPTMAAVLSTGAFST